MGKSGAASIALLFILAIAVVAAAPFAGMQFISPADVFGKNLQATVFWTLRVPRVLAAFIAGSGLALCGMMFQAMFRNALADPFTLGYQAAQLAGLRQPSSSDLQAQSQGFQLYLWVHSPVRRPPSHAYTSCQICCARPQALPCSLPVLQSVSFSPASSCSCNT